MNYSTEKELTGAFERGMSLLWSIEQDMYRLKEKMTKLYEDNLMMLREKAEVQGG